MKSELISIDDPRVRLCFGQLAFATNRFMLAHMKRIVQNLDMDLESSYILGILSHLNLAHGLHHLTPPEDAIKGSDTDHFVPVRLRDVVTVTSLPRETVRRKLNQMLALGLVLQPKAGHWCINMKSVDSKMREVTLENVSNLLETADRLWAILAASDVVITS